MTPTYDGEWRGCDAVIVTRHDSLEKEVVASLTMITGPDRGLSTIYGLGKNCRTEEEVFGLLNNAVSGENIVVGAQTSIYPAIHLDIPTA